MFRIPSLRELANLFLTNKTVASATHAISSAVKRLEEVAEHHMHHSQHKSQLAADLRVEALSLTVAADQHAVEAGRALRVRDNLAHLLG